MIGTGFDSRTSTMSKPKFGNECMKIIYWIVDQINEDVNKLNVAFMNITKAAAKGKPNKIHA